jgi:PTS system mannose-specific IIC component
LSLARSNVSVGFIDRPIFAGFLWGAVSGDMALSLSLAVFYELFWLDLFPAGTYIPPNPLFPLFCMLSLTPNLYPKDATTCFLPVILTLPLAFLGAFLEKKHRDWQSEGYNRLLIRFRTAGDLGGAAAISAGISLMELFIINFVSFFCTVWLVLFIIMDVAIRWQGKPLIFSHATWPLLWVIGGVGGVTTLRTKHSRTVFVTGSVGVFFLALFGWML